MICCYVRYKPKIANPDQREDNYYSAPHKGNGYGFDFRIDNGFFYDYHAGMFFRAEANVTTLRLAYGFAGYFDKNYKPTFSVSNSGAALNFASTEKLITAEDNHVQMLA